jgi:hypothetical protein
MAGCRKEIQVFVPRGYDYKEITTRCGSTGYYGYPDFCEDCALKYQDRDWKREAEEAGERWDDDY